MLVDAHIHVWSPDFDRYPLAPGFSPGDLWLPSHTAEEHEALTQQLNVPVTGVNLVQMTWYGLDHSYILDLIQADPERYTGTGIIPAVSDVSLGAPERIMRDLARQGIRSFRLRARGAQPQWGQSEQWLDQEGYECMFAAAAEDGLVLSFLTGPADLPEIGRMCARFPDAPVVIDHVGGVRVRDGAIAEDDLQALLALAVLPNVHVKLGPLHGLGDGQAPFSDLIPLLQALIGAFGATRCMWETDCGGPLKMQQPESDLLASVDVIRQADFLSPADKDAIVSTTARQLLWA